MSDRAAGFVLHCHGDGRILRIVNDSTGMLGGEWIGRPFTTLVAPGALAKGLEFFSRVVRQGAQYYWEIPVAPAGRSMVFVGALYAGGIAVAASDTPEALDSLMADLMQVGNEQANLIRSMSAERARTADAGALDEFTRLNIEFANMQRQLARQNVELARANERKGLMLGMAAHDLRNPLQVISGFAEFLRERADDRLDGDEQRFLGHILESSARMLRIIDGVLELSRTETGKLVLDRAPTDLAALLADVVGLQAAIARTKSIAVEAESAGAAVVVEADAGKLRQVLDNLISNAVKYSMPGTTVRVTLSAAADAVTICVADQGQGIPAADLPRLFQPFGRTSVRPTAGESSTGLGLAISKSIVEGHGGTLTVESVAGKGSVFTVRLPLG